MLINTENITINPKPDTNIENYEWLRNAGLGYIQQFSGKLWTDYNLHDPGITMLELLCYALTDISYRLSFPVADILTAEGDKGPDTKDFFTARKILTTHPITINDYRKLLLDWIPSVRNVWLETLDQEDYDPAIYFDKKDFIATLVMPDSTHPYELLQLKGRYVIKLDIEDYATILARHPHHLKTLAQYRDKTSVITDVLAQPAEFSSCIVNYTKNILLNSRNLSEDFETIKVATPELVAVCADIELKPDANADNVFTAIYSALYNYMNPSLAFYSFKELIDKGKKTEDIFNGPAATRGFIDTDELAAHGHKEVLYVSDIINLLMDIDGIQQIKTIHLSSYIQNDDGSYTILEDAQMYCLHLKDVLNDVFHFILDAAELDPTKVFNHIRFSKGPIYFTPQRKASYVNQQFIECPDMPDDFQNDLKVPVGKNRSLTNYYSVQNDFPLTYYTGMNGIPNSETNLRKAQRLQTKAYLLFFDQMLADYLSSLDNVKNVFTWRGANNKSITPAFHLDGSIVKDLRKLLSSEYSEDDGIDDADFFKKAYDIYNKDLASSTQNKGRYNKALDHLLARFNEVFVDYTVFKFQQNKQGDFFSQSDLSHIIEDKVNFLKLYPIISGKRSHAFNYTKSIYATDNISGLQLRVQKMLGITSTQNVQLVTPIGVVNYKDLLGKVVTDINPASSTDKITVIDDRFSPFEKVFGMHVLEHILLRPLYKADFTPITKLLPLCGDGSNNQHADCLLPDYFSTQLTIVLPGWLSISCNMDFRAFTENLIRSEAPAHVAVKICWLDPARMYLFEQTTQAFFDAMLKIKAIGTAVVASDILAFNKALQDVYTMMGILRNVYPPSNLDECAMINYNDETDKINTPIILDFAALGAGEDEEWFVYKPIVSEPQNPDS
jgi:hypothetical protein